MLPKFAFAPTTAVVLCAFGIAISLPVLAQTTTSEQSEYYRRGYGGVKDANVFAPKFRQRLANWSEQMTMAREKGWLTPEEQEQFANWHARLVQKDSEVAAKGYVKPDVDELEQEFTTFNVSLSQAMNKPAPAAVPVATPVVTPAVPVAPPIAKPVAGSPAAKPAAASPAAKPAAAKKVVPAKSAARGRAKSAAKQIKKKRN